MKSRARAVHQQSGFTILEVLVAFLVAALLLAVILSGFSTGLSSLARADRLSQAALVAQSRIAELGVVEPIQAGELSGQDEQHSDYRWQVSIQPFAWDYADAIREQGSILYKVDVEVFWPVGDKEHSFLLSTLKSARLEQL
ncbi:MAG TPA: prepilin-type N-terminal cleavage/methylation domain-containing protein [Thiopseudomonas sp.]|nr:prepilin-type N-terminal cleavage/methylation domain-containing protein [Thiopseudomonas sp.]